MLACPFLFPPFHLCRRGSSHLCYNGVRRRTVVKLEAKGGNQTLLIRATSTGVLITRYYYGAASYSVSSRLCSGAPSSHFVLTLTSRLHQGYVSEDAERLEAALPRTSPSVPHTAEFASSATYDVDSKFDGHYSHVARPPVHTHPRLGCPPIFLACR